MSSVLCMKSTGDMKSHRRHSFAGRTKNQFEGLDFRRPVFGWISLAGSIRVNFQHRYSNPGEMLAHLCPQRRCLHAMQEIDYLMESAEEVLRLDVKTESTVVEGQALWAGIRPGMSVADIGFGSGKTSAILHSLVQPGGSVLGVDGSGERTAYATSRYGDRGIRFVSGIFGTPSMTSAGLTLCG